MSNLLIIGSLPPPLGGVTIHTSRLLYALEMEHFHFDFMKLKITNLILLIFRAKNYKSIHIHSSNPFVRLYVMIICKILRIYGIVTIHGDINRFSSDLKNYVDRKTIEISKKPIVLNKKSYSLTRHLNSNLEIISSFIPPALNYEHLDQLHIDAILKMKKMYKLLICSNASVLSFDKDQREIYGIFEIIDGLKSLLDFGMILSDPSGSYLKFFQERSLNLPQNIYIINGNHSFYRVLELSDASIRNTSTDGDSISIHESLYLNKWTFASDCVSRPAGCILYKRGHLFRTLSDFCFTEDLKNLKHIENGFPRIKEIYNLAEQ